MSKISVYLASGWFTKDTEAILSMLEKKLTDRADVDLYSPRRDGVKLTPNQRHDTALRESVFNDNLKHINVSDMVLANIYSKDWYNDPGTIYEIGYAMANGIPVVGFTPSHDNIDSRFNGILEGFECILYTESEVDKYFSLYEKKHAVSHKCNKVLLVGNGDDNVDSMIASYIMDSGSDLRWLNDSHDDVYPRIDEVFKDVEYMIAVIDDRKTLVSWMIGQAYARGIPVITYSNQNYGINVMLLVSILTHLRGSAELISFLQKVKREGLSSIPKFDISQIDSM